MEGIKRDASSGSMHRKRLNDTEISKYFLIEFFKAIPESVEEKDIKEVKLLRIIVSYYDKCCELLEKECEESETVQIVRKNYKWSRELSGLCSTCSIEEVTFATETLLLEYEICVHDVSEKSPKEKALDEGSVDPEKSLESEDEKTLPEEKGFLSRSKPECLEVLIGIFFHVDQIQAALTRKIALCKNGTHSAEKAESMEADDSENGSLHGKKDSETDSVVVKRLNNRMEFITCMKLLIRATLLLFKRLNPKWMELKNEDVSEAMAVKETSDSPSVESSSDSPENPPSAASSSSATEVYELSSNSLIEVSEDQSSMDVDDQ